MFYFMFGRSKKVITLRVLKLDLRSGSMPEYSGAVVFLSGAIFDIDGTLKRYAGSLVR